MKQKISTQLAAGFALIVLITVAVISITANSLISRQFEQYVARQREAASSQLAESLAYQYHAEDDTWNVDYIHGLGMYALKDGYLIKLSDTGGRVIWDAENHDMTLCHQIMQDIRTQMAKKRPGLDGNFTTHRYEVKQDNAVIGHLEVSYYSPYYLNESDFRFLDALNRILLAVGICAAFAAAAAGVVLAKTLSVPLLNVTELTRKIAEGDYGARFEAGSTQTQELSELSNAVNHMAESLERQELLRRRLTSDVAHELRTPVANVSLNLEMLLEGIWEPEPERLKSCYAELERISGIISDLEKLRQIEAEQLELETEPVELLELSRSVVTAFEPDLKQKYLTCTVSGEPTVVLGDQKRLHQVIFNLVSNAVKYSTEGGEIQVRIRNEKKKAVLIVEDQGIGIAQEELPMIFERFYRTDLSRSRKTGGAGIGLAIVKAIVQAHQGTVTVTSKVGCGSRFTVTLPADEKQCI